MNPTDSRELNYETPIAPGELRREETSNGVSISVGPRTAGQIVSSFQWHMLSLAGLTAAALAGGACSAALFVLPGPRVFAEDVVPLAMASMIVAVLSGGMLVHSYRLRAKPTVFSISAMHLTVSPDDDRLQEISVPRERVSGIEVASLRFRPFARSGRVLRISLFGAPPLVALSGCDERVVRAAADAIHAELARPAEAWPPPPVPPAALVPPAVLMLGSAPSPPLAAVPTNPVAPVPIIKRPRIDVSFVRLPEDEPSPAADDPAAAAAVRTEADDWSVRVIVARLGLRRWVATHGRAILVLLASSAVAAGAMSATVLSLPESGSIATRKSEAIMFASSCALIALMVPWLWSITRLAAVLRDVVRPAVFTVTRDSLEVPARSLTSPRTLVHRYRITDVAAGTGWTFAEGNVNVLMIEVEGFQLYTLAGRERAVVIRAAGELRGALTSPTPL